LTFVLLDNAIDREYCNCKYIKESNFKNDNFFIGFLSLSLLEMPTHVLIGNVKQKSFVNLFTRRRKEEKKKKKQYMQLFDCGGLRARSF
jgi:hypothetical protein